MGIIPPEPLPIPPESWRKSIAGNADLKQLLNASNTKHSDPDGLRNLPPLPPKWIEDIAADPRLLRLLRPEIRPRSLAVSNSLECYVSAYFDDRGTCLELRPGDGAGKLVDATPPALG